MIKDFILYIKERYRPLLLVIMVAAIVYSCANMASPSGGDYDFDPPKIVRTIPALNSTNVMPKKIEIIFDELVQVENVSDKVIVTPPQKKMPQIQAISNKVVVQLKDTLMPNTTYTIDFTDAIVDNNEKNPFENFAFSFSTGDVIDTLAVSGKVLDAQSLEPVKGIYVGLHDDLNDSAFITKPFDRISRTNDKGEFTIRGIASKEYKIYALNDVGRTYVYDNRDNAIAFLDTLISPSHVQAFREDTVFNKAGIVDSVKTVEYTRFLPDNIVLRSFTSSAKRQYFQKHERSTADQVRIIFGAPTQLAEVTPLNFESTDNSWSVLERSAGNDSLLYWITDPKIVEMDTLKLQVKYNVTDSLYNIVSKTDTLSFIDRNKRKAKEKDNKKKKDEKEEVIFLGASLKGVSNLFDTVAVTFAQPVYDFDKEKFTLQRLVDSVYVDEAFEIMQNPNNPRIYSFIHKWEPGQSYKLFADSAAFHGYSELWTNKLSTTFGIRKLEEYGDLYIGLSGLENGTSAFVELLNASDKPVRKSKVRYQDGEAGALFMHLMPGKYYARITMDKNANGVWDTGDYYKQEEPEIVYYCDKYFEVLANWQKEEHWDIMALPIDKQKPLEITKNKPKEKESRRKQLEEQENKQRKQEKDNRSNENNFNNNLNLNRSLSQ